MTRKTKEKSIPEIKASEIVPETKAWSEPPIDGFTNTSPLVYAAGYIPSDTGVVVGPISALQTSACYAAVTALATDIGKLPLHLFAKNPPKTKNGKPIGGITTEIIHDHPVLDALDEPNNWQTGQALITTLVHDLVLYGNAYCYIVRNDDGSIEQLIPVSPLSMNVMIDQSGNGELYYWFTHPMYPADVFMCGQENMVHVRNTITTPGGVFGHSPIAIGAQVLGLGIATQKSAAVMFVNGAQIRGILSYPGKISQEAAKRLGESFSLAYAGVQNANKTMILEGGTTWTQTGQTATDSQLLESRKFQIEEIARFLRVPTVKIGEFGRANFSNVVELNEAYISDCLIGITSKFEAEFRRKFFITKAERKKYFFRFSFDDMLRGNELERMQANQIARFAGILTQNEIRAREHKNPVPGGDTFLSPLNMTLTGKPDAQSGIQFQPNPDAADEPDNDDTENTDE